MVYLNKVRIVNFFSFIEAANILSHEWIVGNLEFNYDFDYFGLSR